MTDDKLNKLIKEYHITEQEILKRLDDMENAECTFDDSETITFIHEGEFSEIMKRCINCGGYIEND